MPDTDSAIDAGHADLVKWRHDIHKHPELGFEEHRMSQTVADLLEGFGLDAVHRNIGQTGVVGVLKRGNSERAIGLRADMDALPIQEANEFEHRSVNQGVFHGCGHDGHTTMLLGAARHLAIHGEFDGTVYFIFQPSEEDGRGGHASMPERTVDPVVIGSEIVLALQTIVSRSVSPRDWCVVSVTEFITDGARNVIPSNVIIRGDCRALSIETQKTIEERMRSIVDGICSVHGATAHVEYRNDFVPTINSSAETDAAIDAARIVAGDVAVDPDCPICGASEDFARMLRVKPGCYIMIGNGSEGPCATSLHNPHYDLNDEILSVGTRYWTTLVEQQLGLR